MNEYAFEAKVLIDSALAAESQSGLSDFGDARFKEGLDVLLETYEGAADLSEKGRKMNWKRVVQLLATRLRIEQALKLHPEIREREIKRPFFLTGLPRTGTSALFNLLGKDPATRPLLLWEGVFPDPVEGLEPGQPDPRHAAMKDAYARMREKNPDFTKIHFADADTPEECVLLLAHSFENVHNGIEVLMEPYQSWFQARDFHHSYAEYRDLLKMLDWQRPGDRWLLKTPAHLWAMDTLVDLFPDCSIILTHRNLNESVGSYCSMMETLFASRGCGPQANLGETVLEYMARSMEHGLAARAASDPKRFIDVRFDDFVSDPMTQIRGIYTHFELPLEPEAEAVMQDYVAQNPKGKHGEHDYDLARYGLDEAKIRDRFRDYVERFDL